MLHRELDPQPQASVVHLIRRAEQCAIIALQKRAHELNATPSQIIVLTVISARPGLSQTALCNATGIDRSTMTDVVRRLVEKGLARCSRTKLDARTNEIKLTREGQMALDAAAPAAALAEQDLLSVLPPAHRYSFMRSLRTIIDALGASDVSVPGDGEALSLVGRRSHKHAQQGHVDARHGRT
jgi:DNA-binding MarR family transcriptional regulator